MSYGRGCTTKVGSIHIIFTDQDYLERHQQNRFTITWPLPRSSKWITGSSTGDPLSHTRMSFSLFSLFPRESLAATLTPVAAMSLEETARWRFLKKINLQIENHPVCAFWSLWSLSKYDAGHFFSFLRGSYQVALTYILFVLHIFDTFWQI